MTQNLKFGLMAIFALILMWMMTQISSIQSQNSQLQEKLISVEKDAAHYALLKKRWDKPKVQKDLLEKLSKMRAFDKRFSKNTHEVVVYKNLDAKTLDQLSYVIFASDVKLVEVAMHKDKDKMTLSVEMKR